MGRVLIADEQPLFRDAIRGVVEQFFAEQAWDFVCQEANSIEALMRLADDEDDLDAVLLDLSLLREQGFAELVALRSKLRKQLEVARARLNDTREAVRERAEVAIADADDYVHENPWQTIAIVGGVALIAGALFASRLR